jgi:hypothetical protein
MRRLLSLIICSILALSLYSEEEDIFAEFDRMEIDKEYKDDFIGFDTSKIQEQPAPSLVTHPYDAYSERAWMRDERSLGGLLSQETIARVFYMTLFPQVRLKIGPVNSYLGLPMRFPLYDNIEGGLSGQRRRGFVYIEDFIAPRGADFRSFADAFKLIRQIEWGSIFDDLYIGLVREQAFSLGQGDLMRELNTDYLYDQDYLFARAHASFDPVRIDAVVGPVPGINIVGINTKIQPLKNLESISLVKNMSFDLSYVADYRAPGQAHRQEDAYVLEADRRLVKRDKNIAQGASLGIATLYTPWPWFSSKPYMSFSNLWFTGLRNKEELLPTYYGFAFNLGHDASFYFSSPQKDSVLFFRSEGRIFSENYQPNYFGSNYMLDRVNFQEEFLTSKLQAVAQPEDKKWRLGYMLELGYAFKNIINTKLTYESAHVMNNAKLIVPLRKLRFANGLKIFDWVKIQASYEANALQDFKDIFNFSKSRAILALHGRAKILSYLYFDSWIKHSFGISNIYEASTNREWLSEQGETRSLNFGLGLELVMAF